MSYWAVYFIVLLTAYLIFRVVVRRDYLQRGSLSFLTTTLEIISKTYRGFIHHDVAWCNQLGHINTYSLLY